jgi:hypothetical protein
MLSESQNADTVNIGGSSGQGNDGRDKPDDTRRKGKERDSDGPPIPARREMVIQIQNLLDLSVLTRVLTFPSASLPTFIMAYLFKVFKSEAHSRLRYDLA